MALTLAAPTGKGEYATANVSLARVLDGLTIKLSKKEAVELEVFVPDEKLALISRGRCEANEQRIAPAATSGCAEVARLLRAVRGSTLQVTAGDRRGARVQVVAASELLPDALGKPVMVEVSGVWEPAGSQTLVTLAATGGRALIRSGEVMFAFSVPKSAATPVRAPEPPCTDEKEPLSPEELAKQCYEALHPSVPASGDALVPRIGLCVDLTTVDSPRFCVPSKVESPLSFRCDDPTEIPANHNLDIRMFHRPKHVVEANPGGDIGTVSVIFSGSAPKTEKAPDAKIKTACDKPFPIKRQEFAPRTNEYLDLKVTVHERGGEKPALVGVVSKPLRVKRAFRFALRTGIGVTYSPLDRKYEARGSGNVNNPGKEVVVSSGDASGIGNAELMLGVSWFSEPVDSNEYDPVFSVFVGLGVLSGNDKGVQAFSSLVAGPELSLGKDFSIALVGGMRRTEVLEDDIQVGGALPPDEDEVPTVFGVTPMLGLMVNLSPYVFGTQ